MRDEGSGIEGSRIQDSGCAASHARSQSVQQKGGRRSPPFLAGTGSYRFLPPFFFPPLAAFFAIAFIPPFVWDSFARSILRIAAPLPAGTRRCVHTPLVASVGHLAHSIGCAYSAANKIGGAKLPLTPPRP